MENQVFGQQEYVFTYGKRNQYNITLWPLSLGDQLKVSNLVVTFISSLATVYAQSEVKGQAAIVDEGVNLIAANISKIIALAADLPEDDDRVKGLVDNMTNMQLATAINYIWETNYGSVRKNYASLIEELGSLLGKK